MRVEKGEISTKELPKLSKMDQFEVDIRFSSVARQSLT